MWYSVAQDSKSSHALLSVNGLLETHYYVLASSRPCARGSISGIFLVLSYRGNQDRPSALLVSGWHLRLVSGVVREKRAVSISEEENR